MRERCGCHIKQTQPTTQPTNQRSSVCSSQQRTEAVPVAMRQVLACVARAVEARYPLTMDDLSRLIVGTVDARIDAATGPYFLVSWKDRMDIVFWERVDCHACSPLYLVAASLFFAKPAADFDDASARFEAAVAFREQVDDDLGALADVLPPLSDNVRLVHVCVLAFWPCDGPSAQSFD